jgi:hypothetical protein
MRRKIGNIRPRSPTSTLPVSRREEAGPGRRHRLWVIGGHCASSECPKAGVRRPVRSTALDTVPNAFGTLTWGGPSLAVAPSLRA